jgi:hypothetical protein
MPKRPLLTDEDLTDLPWEDGEGGVAENLDPKKLRTYVRNLMNDKIRAQNARDAVKEEKDELVTRVSELEDAGADASKVDATVKELRAQVKDLEKTAGEPSRRELQFEVALEKGLTKRQALRLVGDSLDDLLEDADAFLEEVGTKPDGDNGDNGEPGAEEPPAPGRRPRDMKTGFQRGDQTVEEKLPEFDWLSSY